MCVIPAKAGIHPPSGAYPGWIPAVFPDTRRARLEDRVGGRDSAPIIDAGMTGGTADVGRFAEK